jgi:2-polyprenyl-6-methoxyphenol hydroxylase-like FAD-dependent oxidoreductase
MMSWLWAADRPEPSAALELASNGLRAIVLESQPSRRWKIDKTLPPEARTVLQSMGVWKTFLRDGHLPSVGICSAWGSAKLSVRDFILTARACYEAHMIRRSHNRIHDGREMRYASI